MWTEEQTKLIGEGIDYIDRLQDIDISNSKLGSEVLYNMVCLGVEAIFTGVLLKYDCVIDHSGIYRLLRELKTREDVPQDWDGTAKLMGRFQTYCSLDIIPAKIPTDGELRQMFDFGTSVKQFAVVNMKAA